MGKPFAVGRATTFIEGLASAGRAYAKRATKEMQEAAE
jgi:hypothetical protein